MRTEIESPSLTKVRALVEPIAADLGLDLYDIEQRGGTLRVTLDTPAGSPAGVTLDILALASRLVSQGARPARSDAGRYTLEVTSPGVERSLRTPAHFQREVGKLGRHPPRRRRPTTSGGCSGVARSPPTTTPSRAHSPTGHRSASSYDQIDRARRCSSGGRNRSRAANEQGAESS